MIKRCFGMMCHYNAWQNLINPINRPLAQRNGISLEKSTCPVHENTKERMVRKQMLDNVNSLPSVSHSRQHKTPLIVLNHFTSIWLLEKMCYSYWQDILMHRYPQACQLHVMSVKVMLWTTIFGFSTKFGYCPYSKSTIQIGTKTSDVTKIIHTPVPSQK